ncbi:putative hsp70 nucleotide exchange factor fes1 protein [Phialemonium atrogriseum]|uniref:Hsp70 nucleotide exchange factor fes1 protein n=1 Tax=Phialemonium atrogriseum TaxID=1093897 RepID=A0AAJ0C5M0_9PEZI|nr:putative hsp70 nucleotide exchange factor fes1 protein [Phialemonium atrogriseum]KAK1770603.1 putative hsp70 nucleotide exchange factor fes1 protein [Phialemonium atrogriseum]
MDRGMSELLKWSIENTAAANGTAPNEGSEEAPAPERTLNREALAALMGGPSDAELMRAAMSVITDTDPSISLENKMIAFDNFEQLIESLDNANNLGPLSLWAPLILLLEHDERDLRRMAAWCVGTAVQNNSPSQERLLAMGGIPPLVRLAVAADHAADPDSEPVRRKAVYALSSAVRNYQPAMDAAAEELARHGAHSGEKVDATNMDAVDEIIERLRERRPATAAAATAPV